MSPGIVLVHTPHYYILIPAPRPLLLLHDRNGGRTHVVVYECLPARLFPSAPLPVQTWIHCTGHLLHRQGQADKLRHTGRSYERIG